MELTQHLYLGTLKNFIREYSNIIQKEIKDFFNFIKEFQNGDKQGLFNKATLLFERLEEISDITDKYPNVLEQFHNKKIKEECQRSLEKYAEDLGKNTSIKLTSKILIHSQLYERRTIDLALRKEYSLFVSTRQYNARTNL